MGLREGSGQNYFTEVRLHHDPALVLCPPSSTGIGHHTGASFTPASSWQSNSGGVPFYDGSNNFGGGLLRGGDLLQRLSSWEHAGACDAVLSLAGVVVLRKRAGDTL